MSADDSISHDSKKFIEDRRKEVQEFTDAVVRFLAADTERDLFEAMRQVIKMIEVAANARGYLITPKVKKFLEAEAFQYRMKFEVLAKEANRFPDEILRSLLEEKK